MWLDTLRQPGLHDLTSSPRGRAHALRVRHPCDLIQIASPWAGLRRLGLLCKQARLLDFEHGPVDAKKAEHRQVPPRSRRRASLRSECLRFPALLKSMTSLLTDTGRVSGGSRRQIKPCAILVLAICLTLQLQGMSNKMYE